MRGRSLIPLVLGVVAILVAATTDVVRAEPPSTAYIFPAGGQRGTRVVARVGGHYLHERASFAMTGGGVTAPTAIDRIETRWFEGPLVRLPASQQAEDYPKDYGATLEIAADAPLGMRHWYAWNAQGVTTPRRFVVGELPEVVEEEWDGEPIPTSVTLPVTINGRIFPREDVDEWTFTATAGRTISCVVAASNLGSPLEARIEALDSQGLPIAEATGGAGEDPQLSFVAREAGTYRVRIHDVRGQGLQSYVYRLTVTEGPWVRGVYPLGGRRGAEVAWTLSGANVPGEVQRATVPANAVGDRFTMQWNVAGRDTNPVVVAAGDWPEALENEPNDELGSGLRVAPPIVLNGRIEKPGDIDGWRVELAKGIEYGFAIQAARWGSPLDSVITVLDAQGREVAKSEVGQNGSFDADLRFTPPADGVYDVRVAEQFRSRGGPQFAYRLSIEQTEPRVRLEFASDTILLERGKPAKLAVQVHRDGGSKASVELSLEGAPAGVTAAPIVVPANANNGSLAVEVAGDAVVGPTAVRIVGRVFAEGKTVADSTEKVFATIRSTSQETAAARESILLAVTLPTPFKFQGAYEMTYIPCGAVSRKRFTIDRNGYEGPLEVRLADKQTRHLQGVTGPTIIVPPGVTEFVYPITLPPWMELGRTSRVVLMATGEVDDGRGQKHKVSYTSGDQNNQMINLVSPSPLRLSLDRGTAAVEPGRSTRVKVQIRRDRDLKSPVKIELVAPAHLRDVSVPPLEWGPDTEEGELTLVYGAQPGPFTMPVIIRATARRGDDPIVAEAPLELVPLK